MGIGIPGEWDPANTRSGLVDSERFRFREGNDNPSGREDVIFGVSVLRVFHVSD